MNKLVYYIGGALLLVGAGFGAKRLIKTISNITIRPNGTHSFNWLGGISAGRLVFKQNLSFYNPENQKLNIQFKQLIAYKGATQVAFTNPTQNNFTIPARGMINVNDIEIIVPGRYLIEYLTQLVNWLVSTKEEKQVIMNQIINQLSFKVLVAINGHDIEQIIKANGQPTGTNGLGVIAMFNRPIRHGKGFDSFFPNVEKTDPIVMNNGNVEDTVRIMQKMVKQYANDTKKFAQFIKGKDTYDTAKRLWTFMYKHIQYKPDSDGVEQLRRPARVWADRATGVDCDCYSNFIASTLHNLNIPFKFRITKYDYKPYFQHVYVVIPYKGKEIIMDVVLDKFNLEKPYTEKKDF